MYMDEFEQVRLHVASTEGKNDIAKKLVAGGAMRYSYLPGFPTFRGEKSHRSP